VIEVRLVLGKGKEEVQSRARGYHPVLKETDEIMVHLHP
jgi:hypothetical protein